jgi:hypothetical protein
MITIVKTEVGMAIAFPFELKDSFRKVFPSAKWNPTLKRWEMGPRSEKRLRQWADGVSAVIAGLDSLEDKELTEKEILAVKEQVQKIKSEILSARQAIDALGSSEDRLRSLKENLQTEKDGLQKVQQEVIAAKARVNAEAQAVKDLLNNIVDFPAIERAVSEMRKWERQVGRVAHEKFDEAQAVVWEQKLRLKDAGWRCEGLDYLGNANFNRPDRDGVGLMPSGALLEIHKLKTENASETVGV